MFTEKQQQKGIQGEIWIERGRDRQRQRQKEIERNKATESEREVN